MQTEATSTKTVIIGAGPAGLAVGVCLREAGVPVILATGYRSHVNEILYASQAREKGVPT